MRTALKLVPGSAVALLVPRPPAEAEMDEWDRRIAVLDALDGDTDLEEGDTEDAFVFSSNAEAWRQAAGPGCPIGDGDCCPAGEDRGGYDWRPSDCVGDPWDEDNETSRQPPCWPD